MTSSKPKDVAAGHRSYISSKETYGFTKLALKLEPSALNRYKKYYEIPNSQYFSLRWYFLLHYDAFSVSNWPRGSRLRIRRLLRRALRKGVFAQYTIALYVIRFKLEWGGHTWDEPRVAIQVLYLSKPKPATR